MPLLRLARPLWLDGARARNARAFRVLSGTISADVTIIGGGITGATLAWQLASKGISVVVLEAARVGRGSTAASTALLMQEPDEDFSKLRERYGLAAATRIWQMSRRATGDFVESIRALRIPCNLRSRDSIYFTLDADTEADLAREHALRKTAGTAGAWLTPAALDRATGIKGAAGIRTRGNAEVDPIAVTLGFLDRAVARGAAVFERSRVLRVKVDGPSVRVKTARGEVLSDHIVVATGYATPEFKPLTGRFRMLNTYVAATPPLDRSTRRHLGLSDVMLWDTGRPYYYARWTPDGRLILGGADRPRQSGPRRRRALGAGILDVRAYFDKLFPPLRKVGTDYAWEGLFAATPDGLPYIGAHHRYPRHLFALGYGGNGMTFAFLAAQLLGDQLTSGRPTADARLFSFSR